MTLYLMPAVMTFGLERVADEGSQRPCIASGRRRPRWRPRRLPCHHATRRWISRPTSGGSCGGGKLEEPAHDRRQPGRARDREPARRPRRRGPRRCRCVAWSRGPTSREHAGDTTRSPSRRPGSGRGGARRRSSATPPHSLRAPAARTHSGRCSAIHFAPSTPPASSSAVHVKRTSRRRPGIGSRAGSSPAARASAASSRTTAISIATICFMSTAPRP